jgi:hypothetical protein
MKLRSFTVTLHSGAYQAQVFASIEAFLAHAADHFCNAEESWSRVIPKRFLTQSCQKIAAGDVSAIEAFYQRVADAIAEGAAFSANLPLYAVLEQNVQRAGRRLRRQTAIFFIAKPGFVIITHDNVVRTAFFPKAINVRDSHYMAFIRSWKYVKHKCATEEQRDSKHNIIRYRLGVHFENEKHWQRCPRVHQHRGQPAPRKRGSRSRGKGRWLRLIG